MFEPFILYIFFILPLKLFLIPVFIFFPPPNKKFFSISEPSLINGGLGGFSEWFFTLISPKNFAPFSIAFNLNFFLYVPPFIDCSNKYIRLLDIIVRSSLSGTIAFVKYVKILSKFSQASVLGSIFEVFALVIFCFFA